MIRPTPRAVLAFGLGLPVSLLPAMIDARLLPLWPATLAVCALAVALDALLTLPRARLEARFDVPTTLYLGDPDPVRLVLSATAWPRTLTVDLLFEWSALFPPDAVRRVALATGGAETSLDIALAPRRRGMGRIDALWLGWSGPLGLVRRTERRALDRDVPVVPNVRAVRAAAIRLFRAQHYLTGLQAVRHLGDGSEFEQLREYVPGLDHRTMNWKHSARSRRLICTDHRAERNQQIVLALDTGHLMGEPLGGLPRLDHAINAALLLAYYSLRAGDRVGLFAFDDRARLFIEPAAGVKAFGRLQHATAALEYGPTETNFTLGLTTLSQRLKRRSLVIVVTDFVDTTTALLMAENLQRLGRRHAVVFVSLVDPQLLAQVRAPLDSGRSQAALAGDFGGAGALLAMNRAVVADDLLRERETVLRTIRRAGIMALDTPPEHLSTQLLNRYLEIKRRELI